MTARRRTPGSETALSKSINDALELHGCRVIRIQSGKLKLTSGKRTYWIHMADKGTPDLLVIRPGAPLASGYAAVGFLEVKTAAGKLSPEQHKWHAWAKSADVNCAVVRTASEAVNAVMRWT